MQEPKPYELADKTILTLNKRAIRLFEASRRKLSVLKFDELSVIKEVKALYESLDSENRKEFIKLFIARYKQVNKDYEDTIDEIAEMYIAGMLSEPNEVTHYIYETEVLRKRDRLAEAVNSSTAKNEEMDKGLKFWSQMTSWYVDFTADGANIEALRALGVKEVVWHAQEDEKVCRVCEEMDGEIYPINKIPPKPHLHCRCYVTAFVR